MRIWFEEKNAPAAGTRLCGIHDIEPGKVKEFVFAPESKYPFHLFIFNDAGTIRCFMNKCPHFGIPLNLEPGDFFTSRKDQFMCCHHYARFNFQDGLCTDGPPEGSSLETIPIEIRDDVIYIAEDTRAQETGTGITSTRKYTAQETAE